MSLGDVHIEYVLKGTHDSNTMPYYTYIKFEICERLILNKGALQLFRQFLSAGKHIT